MTIKTTIETTWRITEVTVAASGDGVAWEVTAESTFTRSRFGQGAHLPAACQNLADEIGDTASFPAIFPAIYAEAKQLLEGEQ